MKGQIKQFKKGTSPTTGLSPKVEHLTELIENLAIITTQGFQEVHVQLNDLKQDVSRVEQNMEEVKLRLDNVPYRFELKALEVRVDHLERRKV